VNLAVQLAEMKVVLLVERLAANLADYWVDWMVDH
jgi:hypothetical protein